MQADIRDPERLQKSGELAGLTAAAASLPQGIRDKTENDKHDASAAL